MIEQQLDLQRPSVQVRGWQGVDSLAEGGSGDRARVDRVGLPTGSLLPAFSGGQVRRDPDDTLSGAGEKPLEGAGEVPAVLQCPYPLGVSEITGPVEQFDEPSLARRDRLVVEKLPIGGVYRGEGVGVLVCVRSEEDHSYRPFIIGSVVWADRWLTRVTWGVLPRSYQVKPAVLLGRRRATQQRLVRPQRGVDSFSRSQLAAYPRHPTPPAGQQHHRRPGTARMTVTLSTPGLLGKKPSSGARRGAHRHLLADARRAFGGDICRSRSVSESLVTRARRGPGGSCCSAPLFVRLYNT